MKTKRHKFQFYFFLAFALIMCYTVVFVAIYSFFESMNKPEGANYLILVVGILMFLYSIDIFLKFIKYFPIIGIDDKTIKIKKRTYNLSDIEEIELTGKVPIKFIVDSDIEGIYIRFNNDETLYIYDNYYSNIGQIKAYLKEILDIKEQNIDFNNNLIVDINDTIKESNSIIIFKGKLSKVAKVFIPPFVVFLVFILFAFINKEKNIIGFSLTLFGFYILLMSLICYNWMYYYYIDNGRITVRNYFLKWINKTYDISDISEIVIEQMRFSVGLRLIMKDYSSVIYPGMTLKPVNWIELQNEFERRGIIVRNECFSVD